ncbi:hypothetical protein SAMN05878482_10955 [Peribacillus simplex]|uniref:Endospore appendages core domain-containing protein n=1 Tax=Peribacillus simplex TaxID=1478 RepID=A0A9X8WMU5_9BACI|nr:hypothetical protein SAMN05878482_10955 [Peribacillus simplex]
MKNCKCNCCSPAHVRSKVRFTLDCDSPEVTIYQALNLDCLPTVTVTVSLDEAERPCTLVMSFFVGTGQIMQNVVAGNNGVFADRVVTFGNISRISIQCGGNGADGCSGEITLDASFCVLCKCNNDDQDGSSDECCDTHQHHNHYHDESSDE